MKHRKEAGSFFVRVHPIPPVLVRVTECGSIPLWALWNKELIVSIRSYTIVGGAGRVSSWTSERRSWRITEESLTNPGAGAQSGAWRKQGSSGSWHGAHTASLKGVESVAKCLMVGMESLLVNRASSMSREAWEHTGACLHTCVSLHQLHQQWPSEHDGCHFTAASPISCNFSFGQL